MSRQTVIRQGIGLALFQVALLVVWWDHLSTATQRPWWLAAVIVTQVLMVGAVIDLIRRARKAQSPDPTPDRDRDRDRDAAKRSTPPTLSR